MRPGQQVGDFGAAVDAVLANLAPRLPVDLQLARPSDQPLQVRENVGLFMKSLYEAIALVILVALIGFWEWRSALVMACAIPLTLAMTFGLMDIFGIDIQQVSVASLIIALGLLVDDPVVAGDAIKRELDHRHPNIIAAWLGPTKLATAILFATITNIVAYLPLLLLKSQTGAFIYSLPVVLACSLVASRIVSMTFGMMATVDIDIQQISIASIIIALGLLADDPVVAGDAIKRDLAAGNPPVVAAWLGPTKLATAIMFATITNIVAYLPFLLLTGDTGKFLYSLPVVIVCSLVASRIVSMTFIPLLGYYLLRPRAEPSIEERRHTGFGGWYYRVGHAAILHRRAVLAGSVLFLALGVLFASRLKSQFFPKDLQYLSYVDIWLPEDAQLTATREAAEHVETVVRAVTTEFGRAHRGFSVPSRSMLQSLTTFIGGGGPRFWFSATPELQQLNYAQVIIQVEDKHDTSALVLPLQQALSAQVPNARVSVQQLETGPPVGTPVAIRISGEDIPTLRRLANEMAGVFRAIPLAERVSDSWGADAFNVRLTIDADRANLAGITNQEVAGSTAAAMNGLSVGTLRDGEDQIPVVARLRMDERAQLSDIQNLYVYAAQGKEKIPLSQVSRISYDTRTEKIVRRKQFRTITVSAFPVSPALPSQLLNAALPQVRAFERQLAPGYHLEIGGEYEEQQKGFRNLAIVMGISIAMIFLALVIQFRHAVKPFIVFAAIPYGMVGAFFALWISGSPFGFMAFLGIASLMGVIVSHIIVLFDFIEERREHGDSLHDALLGAGIMRLRPVLITVGATVIALFPLAGHGGPLWEPMCYAQIGGLTVATFITLLLVPVIYAVFVLDLGVVKWEATGGRA